MGSTDVGRHPTSSKCRQGAGTSEVGGRKPMGFRPGQEVSCHGMTAGSTHPCSRTHSSNAFPAEEKTALTFCALSNMFRPNTHRAAQEFGQFSSGWEPTGRRARASSLRTPVPAQEFGQFLTANPTQRRCIDANGNTRRPIPTQEFGQFFEERRGLTLATAHRDGL